jgi:hypothetical protein
MRLLWISLTCLGGLAIVIFSVLPIDMESLGAKWSVIIVFVFASVRLIYYENKSIVLRVITISAIILMLYCWRFDLNLGRSWTPQVVMYENKHILNRTIELQTMKTGEWPEKRIVDRFSLLPSVYWKTETDELTVSKLDTLTWRKVSRRIR